MNSFYLSAELLHLRNVIRVCKKACSRERANYVSSSGLNLCMENEAEEIELFNLVLLQKSSVTQKANEAKAK